MAARVRRQPADAGEHRQARMNLRLSTGELAELRHAAARTRETPAGYTARVALMLTRGQVGGGDPGEVRELAHQLIQVQAQLHQLWSLLDHAVTAAEAAGQGRLVDAVQRCGDAWQRAGDAADGVVAYLRRQHPRRR
jgi:hypothetical protein